MIEAWTELEKIDLLRKRMGVGYEEANTALHSAEGDVMKALDDLERDRNCVEREWYFEEKCSDILDSIKNSLRTINRSTVSLKRHDNTIVTLSAPLGLALAYTLWRNPNLRLLALAGAVGAAMNDFELEVTSTPEYSCDSECRGI